MSCFKIQYKDNIIITDPFADKLGIKMPKFKTDIVILSEPEDNNINNTRRLSGDYFLIDKAGEYELREIFIYGIKAGVGDQSKNLIYSLEAEGILLGFLGLLNHSLTNTQLQILEGVDILLLPISSLTSERRTKIISQVDPRIIIPMYYHIPKLKVKLEAIDKFAKEVGVKNIDYQDKLIVKKKHLPQDETKIVFLKPSK